MFKIREFLTGIRLRLSTYSSATHDKEGALYLQNDTGNRLKTYVDGAKREVITTSQSQTLTNKTIDVDNNTLSNVEVDNLKTGVLNTDLSGASTDVQLPSALAAKTFTSSSVSTHAGLTTTHGVSGTIVGTSDNQILTTKTIDADNNTISNLETDNLKSGVLNINLGAGATDSQLPSALAAKSYADSVSGAVSGTLSAHIGSTAAHGATGAVVGTTNTQTLYSKTLDNPTVVGDITHARYKISANTQAILESQTNTSITGLNMAAYKSAKILAYVAIDATSDLFETVDILVVKRASDYKMSVVTVGDTTGLTFNITSAGQIQYSSGAFAGFVSANIYFEFTGLL